MEVLIKQKVIDNIKLKKEINEDEFMVCAVLDDLLSDIENDKELSKK